MYKSTQADKPSRGGWIAVVLIFLCPRIFCLYLMSPLCSQKWWQFLLSVCKQPAQFLSPKFSPSILTRILKFIFLKKKLMTKFCFLSRLVNFFIIAQFSGLLHNRQELNRRKLDSHSGGFVSAHLGKFSLVLFWREWLLLEG